MLLLLLFLHRELAISQSVSSGDRYLFALFLFVTYLRASADFSCLFGITMSDDYSGAIDALAKMASGKKCARPLKDKLICWRNAPNIPLTNATQTNDDKSASHSAQLPSGDGWRVDTAIHRQIATCYINLTDGH